MKSKIILFILLLSMMVSCASATIYSYTGVSQSPTSNFTLNTTLNGSILQSLNFSTATATTDPYTEFDSLNPSGWWKFDEGTSTNVSDSSGNNNHGTVGAMVWTDGKYNTAGQFDGDEDYMTIPHSSEYNQSSWTVSAILDRTSTQSQYKYIVHKLPQSGTLTGWGIRVFGDTIQGVAFVSNTAYSISGPTVSNDNIYHTIMTYNGTYLKLYVNGEYQGSANVGSSLSNNKNIIVGRYASGASSSFYGMIDNVMFLPYEANATVRDKIYYDGITNLKINTNANSSQSGYWNSSSDNGISVPYSAGESITRYVFSIPATAVHNGVTIRDYGTTVSNFTPTAGATWGIEEPEEPATPDYNITVSGTDNSITINDANCTNLTQLYAWLNDVHDVGNGTNYLQETSSKHWTAKYAIVVPDSDNRFYINSTDCQELKIDVGTHDSTTRYSLIGSVDVDNTTILNWNSTGDTYHTYTGISEETNTNGRLELAILPNNVVFSNFWCSHFGHDTSAQYPYAEFPVLNGATSENITIYNNSAGVGGQGNQIVGTNLELYNYTYINRDVNTHGTGPFLSNTPDVYMSGLHVDMLGEYDNERTYGYGLFVQAMGGEVHNVWINQSVYSGVLIRTLNNTDNTFDDGMGFSLHNTTILSAHHNGIEIEASNVTVDDIYVSNSKSNRNFFTKGSLDHATACSGITLSNFTGVGTNGENLAIQEYTTDSLFIHGNLTGKGILLFDSTGNRVVDVRHNCQEIPSESGYVQTHVYGTLPYPHNNTVIDFNTFNNAYRSIYQLSGNNAKYINVNTSDGVNIAGGTASYWYYPNIRVVDAVGNNVNGATVTFNGTVYDGMGLLSTSSTTDTSGELYDSGNRSNWAALAASELYLVNVTYGNYTNNSVVLNPDSAWYSPTVSDLQAPEQIIILNEYFPEGVYIADYVPVDLTPTAINGSIIPFSANLSSSGFWEALVNGIVAANGTGTSVIYNYTATSIGDTNITIRTADDQQTWLLSIEPNDFVTISPTDTTPEGLNNTTKSFTVTTELPAVIRWYVDGNLTQTNTSSNSTTFSYLFNTTGLFNITAISPDDSQTWNYSVLDPLIYVSYWDASNSTANGIVTVEDFVDGTNATFTVKNVTAGNQYKLVYAGNGTEVASATATSANATIVVSGLADGVYWIVESSSGFTNIHFVVGIAFVGAAVIIATGGFTGKRRKKN